MLHAIGPLPSFFLDIYQRYGPVALFQAPGEPDLAVLNGLEANRFVNRCAATHLRVGGFRDAQNRAYGVERTLVSSDGAEHTRLRKLQKRGYSRAALAGKDQLVAALVDQALVSWEPGASVAAVEAALGLVARLIGALVLGHDPRGSEAELVRFLRTVVEVAFVRRPASVLEQPAFLQAREQAYALSDAALAAHGCPAHGPGRPDLVDDLLQALADDPRLLSPAELQVALLGPYIGGLEPVAHSLAFALYALASDPDLAARVQAEVRADPPGPAGCVGLPHPLVRRLVQETLRRYPVTPALRGTATQAFELAGYRIEAGQPLTLGMCVPHFLPEIYPEPLRFCPDRFSDEQNAARPSGAYAPFGLGPHACLGAGLAETLLQTLIGLIVARCDLALDPPGYVLTIAPTPTPMPDQRFRLRVLARVS